MENGGPRLAECLRYPAALFPVHLLLLLAEGRNHGYALVARLREVGAPPAFAGSVYRELARLEDAGLIASFWEATQTRGPARRTYVITPAGVEALAGCAHAATGLRCVLDALVTRQKALRTRRRI
ncbi:MAG TPA: helix-turn-helix transcriptional regulator [Acidimicrobiales bacterium]|nr:helix-turn-helix transcriptional regulator [Acidimicrobiales bacterium]